jgi:hypothetical protein
VTEILREAKRNGWRSAKFYFMIGLPVSSMPETPEKNEETEIVNFVNAVARKTKMNFNVNVGIFVPKPHTPYQWAQQIDSQTAAKKLEFIRIKLKPQGHKVSYSDPLTSMLEGILSRGDERAGNLAEEAFRLGNRLDTWKEFIAKDIWHDILEKNSALSEEFLAAKDINDIFPWQPINPGVSAAYLRNELEKSYNSELTSPCTENCADRCGICKEGERGTVSREQGTGVDARKQSELPRLHSDHMPTVNCSALTTWRLLFSFSKEGSAVFHGHLSLVEIFSMAMCRAGLDVQYTQGFNPLVKMEIVAPLSIGISAGAEMASVDFPHAILPAEFIEKINAALPEGIIVNKAECYKIPRGGKKHSLSSLLWGFGYGKNDIEMEYIPAASEKDHRTKILCTGDTIFSLRRACVLAKNIISSNEDIQWASYFDVYSYLHQIATGEGHEVR